MNQSGIALPNGSNLQEYTIERELGAGTFGITYLAIDENFNKFAIKEYLPNDIAIRQTDQTIAPKSNSDKNNFYYGLDSFIEEAKTLLKFDHPNIVKTNGFFEANGTVYIVMDYEEGEDLQDFLAHKKTLDEDTILSVTLPLLDGLRAVHDQSYLHRDIKPGNIYIRTNGIPMLIDFGASRIALGEKSKSLSVVLTDGYAPKEQYSSRSKQGTFTDLYAIGAVMYKMITGETPIESSARSDAVTDDEPDPHPKLQNSKELSAYGDNLKKAVDWCLELKGKDRPQSVRELQDLLLPDVVEEEVIDSVIIDNNLPHGYILNNNYEILSVLNTDFSMIVYKAYDTILNRYVTVIECFLYDSIRRADYTVYPKSGNDTDIEYNLLRFEDEAKKTSDFQHKTIPQLITFFKANNTAYMVKEDYGEGRNLFDYLQSIDRKLSEVEILSIISSVLDGLEVYHKKGYIHGDMKSYNIFIKKDKKIFIINPLYTKICSKQEESLQSRILILTEGYAPPEQYSSSSAIQPYTDLYAVGAIMYEMIIGKKPIESSARIDAMTDGEADPLNKLQDSKELSKYSENLKKAIDWALEVKGKDRPQSIGALKKALEGKLVDNEYHHNTRDKESNKGKLFILILFLSFITIAITYYKKDETTQPLDHAPIEEWNLKMGWNPKIYKGKRSYSKNSSNTVKDNYTGLIWQKSGSSKEMNWENAKNYCNNLSLDDYKDWRLPIIEELYYLGNITTDSTIDTNYFDVKSSSYWSSTPYKNNSTDMWDVNFAIGNDGWNSKVNKLYVLCVREG